MAKYNPYDGLGRILAQGGDQAIALGLFQGRSDSDMQSLRERRFSDLSDTEFGTLAAFAASASAIGDEIDGFDWDQPIPLGRIPVNSALGGDEPDGKRTRWIGEVEFEGGTKKVLVYGWFPGIPTPQELFDAIEEGGRDIGERYPGKFGLSEDDEVNVIGVRIVYTARRF